ncbi:hypothetical protein N7451_004821 [Penicillium sp. IBT 35674x]|nr:hypothetical protein N7451_004821 [Penicillium sp. IBT 35674x]
MMVVPSPLVTPQAQLQIFEKKGCTLYLRPEEMAESVAGILKDISHIQPITLKALGHFSNETEAIPVNYPKFGQKGKMTLGWPFTLLGQLFVGMLMTLSMTTFVHMTAVIGLAGSPSPDGITEVLRHGHVEGALLPPVLIDALCLVPKSLQALRDLESIQQAGAPLSAKSTELIIPHAQVVPCVGSTEASGYFTIIHGKPDTWDYLAFQ